MNGRFHLRRLSGVFLAVAGPPWLWRLGRLGRLGWKGQLTPTIGSRRAPGAAAGTAGDFGATGVTRS